MVEFSLNGHCDGGGEGRNNGGKGRYLELSVQTYVRTTKCWLGRQDSNLGMAVPKTAALPLGDDPMALWKSLNQT